MGTMGGNTGMKRGLGYTNIGESFDGFLLIKEANRGMASNGKPFLTLIFSDATGVIDAKLWDVTKEDESLFVAEQIVKLTGEINQFRGKAQLKILSLRPAQATDEDRKSVV